MARYVVVEVWWIRVLMVVTWLLGFTAGVMLAIAGRWS